MTTLLITFICLFIALAASAGAFCWGYKVGEMHKDNRDKADELKRASEYVQQLEEAVRQLEYQNEQIAHEANIRREETKPRGFDVFNARG